MVSVNKYGCLRECDLGVRIQSILRFPQYAGLVDFVLTKGEIILKKACVCAWVCVCLCVSMSCLSECVLYVCVCVFVREIRRREAEQETY